MDESTKVDNLGEVKATRGRNVCVMQHLLEGSREACLTWRGWELLPPLRDHIDPIDYSTPLLVYCDLRVNSASAFFDSHPARDMYCMCEAFLSLL